MAMQFPDSGAGFGEVERRTERRIHLERSPETRDEFVL
jgi:hypothetical protein